MKRFKREKVCPEVGYVVSVDRLFFGLVYGNSLPDEINRIFGRVKQVFIRDCRVLWDVDGPECNVKFIDNHIEPKVMPKQKIGDSIITEEDFQSVDQGCSSNAVSTHALLEFGMSPDSEGNDENVELFIRKQQCKRKNKGKKL